MNKSNTVTEYINEWDKKEGIKESNNADFLHLLTKLLKDSEAWQWEFTGENGYCGYTAIFNECGNFPVNKLCLEFAYTNSSIVIFTGHHNGFYVPPYVELKGEGIEIINIIKEKFFEWGGFRVIAESNHQDQRPGQPLANDNLRT